MRIIVFLNLVGTVLVGCATAPVTGPPTARQVSQQEIEDFVSKFYQSWRRGDVAFVEKALDDNMFATLPNGNIGTKSAALKLVKAQIVGGPITKTSRSDWRRIQAGPVVTVRYRATNRVVDKTGAERSSSALHTEVIEDRNGQLVYLAVQIASLPQRKGVDVEQAVLERYAGNYKFKATGAIVTFVVRGGKLHYSWGGVTELEETVVPEADGRFYFSGVDASAEFISDSEGKTTHFIYHSQGNPPVRARRVE